MHHPSECERADRCITERDTRSIALDAIRQAIMECALGDTPETAVMTIARIVQNTDNVLALQEEQRT